MAPTDKEKTFRIGEAAELLELETYVLRFWETEFPHLAPLRTPKGQRLYAERHIEKLRRVKHLLHEQGFTIEGARRVLDTEAVNENGASVESAPSPCQGFLFSPPRTRASEEGNGDEVCCVAMTEAVNPKVAAGNEAVGELVEIELAGMSDAALDGPRLRVALRHLHEELVEVRELLRSSRAKTPFGDDG